MINESGSIGEVHVKIRGKRITGKFEILKDQPSWTSRMTGRLRGGSLKSNRRKQTLKAMCKTTGNFNEEIEIRGKLLKKGRKFQYKGSRLIRTSPNFGYSLPNHFIARIHYADGSGYGQYEPQSGDSIAEFQDDMEFLFDNNPNPSMPYSHIQYIPTDSTGYWSFPDLYKARSKGVFRN